LKILISDDHSTDSTFAIAEGLAQRYRGPHEVRIERTPANLGLMPHLRRCLEMIDTDWVVAAAGDDISVPWRIHRIMREVRRRPEADAVTSSVTVIDEAGLAGPRGIGSRLLSVLPASTPPLRSQRQRTIGYLVNHIGMIGGAAEAWKRSLWLDYPWPNHDCSEDAVAGFRSAIGGGTICIREPLVHYRQHGTNMWSPAGTSYPSRESALFERRKRIMLASLDQHEQDLAFAASADRVPRVLAEELRTILWAKRSIAVVSGGIEGVGARAVAGLLLRTGLDIRGRAPQSRWFPRRVRGWWLRLCRSTVDLLIRQDLGI
jgi:hypothetical protein